MTKQIVIYMPPGVCNSEQRAKIEKRFPGCLIVQFWQDGAMMWQDALPKE